jgi:hypothetical protein
MKLRTMRRAVLQATCLRFAMNPVSIGSGPSRTWHAVAASAEGMVAVEATTKADVRSRIEAHAIFAIIR